VITGMPSEVGVGPLVELPGMIRMSTSAENSVSTVSIVSAARTGSRADLDGVRG
jgi:hypothetical protein